MYPCIKHGDVPCCFFCTTCSLPVCHFCMEKGDHVIPEHHCITLSQYIEERNGEIQTVMDKAKQHKIKHDQVKLKWDTHLSSLEGEFGKLKNEIRLAKQHLLQQMDLAEQSLLETAGIAKSRKETAIKCTKDSYDQNFSAIYRQLDEKCQFLRRKFANLNFDVKEDFQECQNLLHNLQQQLINFDKQDLLGISFTFLPCKTCFIGEVIAPTDADYILADDSESVCGDETMSNAQKRMKTDTGISVPPGKLEEGKSQKMSESVNRSGIDVRTAGTLAAQKRMKTNTGISVPPGKLEEEKSQKMSESVNRSGIDVRIAGTLAAQKGMKTEAGISVPPGKLEKGKSQTMSESVNRSGIDVRIASTLAAQKRMKTDTGISVPPGKLERGKSQKMSESVNRSGIDVRIAGTLAAQKRMKTDRGISVPPGKLEEGKLRKLSESVNRSGIDVRVAGRLTVGVNTASTVNKGSTSSSDVTGHSSRPTDPNFLSPGSFRRVKGQSPVREKIEHIKYAVSALDVDTTSVSRASNSKGNIVVDLCCAGIVWVEKDWLLEVSTTKVSIKIKHHKISDRSQLRPDNIIKCNQTMDDVDLHVCPKIYSPDCSFIVAFKNQVAIISVKGLRGRDVTWSSIPSSCTILAISWRKHPSQFVAIVKGPHDKVSVMKVTEDGLALGTYEVETLSSIGFDPGHPFDVSCNHEFAICNTPTCRILFFSSFGPIIQTRQVMDCPGLNDAKPIAVLVKDDKREWLVLWKGKSPSNGELKWVIARYDASFIFLSIVMQNHYKRKYEKPKAFSVHGKKLAVLHNNLEIVFHNELSSVGNAS